MSGKSVREKMGWKTGQRVLLAGLPDGVEDPFAGVEHATLAGGAEAASGEFDLLCGFVRDSAALREVAPKLLAAASPDPKLWLCYPKLSSKVESDLTRDEGWQPMFDAGWRVVSSAAVDSTWSAVRFRPHHLVKSKKS